MKQIIFASHKLRGLSLSFGADNLTELCKTVELHVEANPGMVTEEYLHTIEQAVQQSYEMLASVMTKLGIV